MIRHRALSVILTFVKTLACVSLIGLHAQNNTRSPYSSRGLGEIEPLGFSLNRALGGVSNGLRSTRYVSVANPASIAGLAKQRVVFDFGVRGDYGQTKSGNSEYDYHNGNFNYLSLAMPVLTTPERVRNVKVANDSASHLHKPKETTKKAVNYKTVWAMAFGAAPFSNIGSYSFKNTDTSYAQYTTTYSVSGGLSNLYIANGFNVTKHLSVGVTTSLLFGQITSYKFQYFTDTQKYFHFDDERIYHMKGFKNEFGAQYHATFGKDEKWNVVVGGTYSVPSTLHYNLTRLSRSYNDQFAKDTLLYQNNVSGTTRIPGGFSVGYAVTYKHKWMLAMDYRQTNWAKQPHNLFKDSFSNSSQFSIGLAIRPDADPALLKRNDKNRYKLNLEYRFGFRYLNTGYNFAGTDGTITPIKEYAMSFGLGIPKIRTDRYTGLRVKSMINITGEYINRGVNNNGLVLENIYRLTIGLNINDIWFLKSKFR